jgi:hypothetical protein
MERPRGTAEVSPYTSRLDLQSNAEVEGEGGRAYQPISDQRCVCLSAARVPARVGEGEETTPYQPYHLTVSFCRADSAEWPTDKDTEIRYIEVIETHEVKGDNDGC